MICKHPQDSKTIMTQLVLPQDTNALDGVFGGTVMSWIDIAAAITAQRHSAKTCVTASIDELHFMKPILKGYIVNIEAILTCVHSSSCEVMVEVSAENPQLSESFHTAKAFLTFVSLDSEGKPVAMPELIPQSDEEKKLFEDAKIRKKNREDLKKKLLEARLKRK